MNHRVYPMGNILNPQRGIGIHSLIDFLVVAMQHKKGNNCFIFLLIFNGDFIV